MAVAMTSLPYIMKTVIACLIRQIETCAPFAQQIDYPTEWFKQENVTKSAVFGRFHSYFTSCSFLGPIASSYKFVQELCKHRMYLSISM